jgi:hypothetical protein
MALGQVRNVEQKPACVRIRGVYLNPHVIALADAIPSPQPNPSGFRWVLGHPCMVSTHCTLLNNNSAISN